MNLANEILQVCFDVHEKEKTPKEATDKLLVLFGVVGRSEQLSCSTCKWLNRTDDYCDTCFNFKKHEPAT